MPMQERQKVQAMLRTINRHHNRVVIAYGDDGVALGCSLDIAKRQQLRDRLPTPNPRLSLSPQLL